MYKILINTTKFWNHIQGDRLRLAIGCDVQIVLENKLPCYFCERQKYPQLLVTIYIKNPQAVTLHTKPTFTLDWLPRKHTFKNMYSWEETVSYFVLKK